MCTKKCDSGNLSLPGGVEIIPVFNQTTGSLEKLVFSINGAVPCTHYKENGVDVANAVVTDTDGNKTLLVKLKYAEDRTPGVYAVTKATNHTFTITATELSSAGWDEETVINFEPYLGNDPMNHFDNNGCTVVCRCRYIGNIICCYCYISCIGDPNTEMRHIDVKG